MDPPRPSHRELTDPKNRNITATLTPRAWACWNRSWARAVELDIPEKQNMLLESLQQTGSFEGRAREDLRDALMGAKPMVQAFGSIAPTGQAPTDGRPHL